jgi:hypothetical protein
MFLGMDIHGISFKEEAMQLSGLWIGRLSLQKKTKAVCSCACRANSDEL